MLLQPETTPHTQLGLCNQHLPCVSEHQGVAGLWTAPTPFTVPEASSRAPQSSRTNSSGWISKFCIPHPPLGCGFTRHSPPPNSSQAPGPFHPAGCSLEHLPPVLLLANSYSSCGSQLKSHLLQDASPDATIQCEPHLSDPHASLCFPLGNFSQPRFYNYL